MQPARSYVGCGRREVQDELWAPSQARPKRVTGPRRAREIDRMAGLSGAGRGWARRLGVLRLLSAVGLSALFAVGCSAAPRVSVNSAVSSLPAPLLHMRDDGLRRSASFGGLHETARLLIIAHGAQAEWLARGVIRLPLASCMAAVGYQDTDAVECTLIALADAETAVLVLSQSEQCDRATCLEQSWVFLNDQRSPVPLPARRAADYSSLRADLSREYAEALWLAGYRGRRDARTADANDPYADPDELGDEVPSVASYTSCTRALHGQELICRSREGHLIGLNPLTSVARVIARLELSLAAGTLAAEGLSAPAFYTTDGQLAIAVNMQRHALCGAGSCTLVGIVADGTTAQDRAITFVRP